MIRFASIAFKFFSIAFLGIGLQSSLAQQQFIQVHGGGSYDFGTGVIETNDGYLVAGYTSSFDPGFSSQILIMGVNDNGFSPWRKTYGSTLSEVATDFVKSPTSDEYLIAGFTETIDQTYQALAMKFDANGDTLWTRTYGGSEWDFCNSAVALSNGGFALVGQTFSDGAVNGDFYLIRIDSNGDTLWTKSFGGEGEDEGNSIAATTDGGFLLAGTTTSFGAGGLDMYVVRTDLNGDTLWTKTYGGVEDDVCNDIAMSANGDFVIVGGSYNLTPGKSDFIIRKQTPTGDDVWVKSDSRDGDNFLTDVIIEPSTQYVTVVGYLTDGPFGGEDGRILRYGPGGTWNGVAKDHGSGEKDRFEDVKLASDGGYIIVGSTQGYYERFDDVWLVKTDFDGLTVPEELGVDEIETEQGTFKVCFVPNPVTDIAAFSISGFADLLKDNNEVLELRVLNAVGQLELIQAINTANTLFQAGDLSPGIKFYQLISESKLLATGKFLKLQ